MYNVSFFFDSLEYLFSLIFTQSVQLLRPSPKLFFKEFKIIVNVGGGDVFVFFLQMEKMETNLVLTIF
jgi:hypothetical protein